MVQAAAQPLFGSKTQTSRCPRPYCTATLKNNPPKSRRSPGAAPFAAGGQIVRFLLAPEETAASVSGRAAVCPMEARQSWLGNLKALFWTAVAIGLSLGISSL